MRCPSFLRLAMLLSLSMLVAVLNGARAKEEIIDDDHLSSNAFDSPIDDSFGPFLTPEEVLPLCTTLFERVQRSNFNPWGGKRSLVKAILRGVNKRSNFNPWGGKRQDPQASKI